MMEETRALPMTRPGFGEQGEPIPLLTNHFKLLVSITSADGRTIEGKNIGRKIMNRMYQTYCSELEMKHFTYDEEHREFTLGPLPQTQFQFKIVIDETPRQRVVSPGLEGNPNVVERKRSKVSYQSSTFEVNIRYAREIPMKSTSLALKGNEAETTKDALGVLNIILSQQAAVRGCLVVRQSFFHDDVRNILDVGGGITACRGFHSSFCTTLGGLTMNMDVSTTMILTPGPVLDFLLANQNVGHPSRIDWRRAIKMLKNLKIQTSHTKMEFIIKGLSEKPCNQQYFSLKMKNENGGDDQEKTVDVTVFEYFTKHRNIPLSYSEYMPCLDVGRPNRPYYLPMELCSVLSLQRYKKALSTTQRSTLVEKSRQKPQEKSKIVTDAVRNYRYEEDSLLSSCGISIRKQLTEVHGRVLSPPMLKVGKNRDCLPRDGRWNFNNNMVFEPVEIRRWAIVNFSHFRDTSELSRKLIDCGLKKGINFWRPRAFFEEDAQGRNSSPATRVEKMLQQIDSKLPSPDFLLCILAERKNSDIYGPWKKKTLCEKGIITQCVSPRKITDRYLTNVLLKINTKLGGKNSLLAVEHVPRIPLVHQTPTMILGMDVSHGPPGQSVIPSIAAVVGSRCWPLISRYRASVRTQSPKMEIIDSLCKPTTTEGGDDGIMRELLVEFYQTSGARKPAQIIIFRDGVSETQFDQVLNIELGQIIKALKLLDETRFPKFTVVVAQKNHHTKFFQPGLPNNVPPGTVVDTTVVHPRNYDFYLCAHAGNIGTSRPVHYNVLLDEIGFSPDDLQKLIHALCYVYQRSTTAVSIVAPIYHAHNAALQMGQFIKLDDFSDSSSGDGITPTESVPVPELPRLHEKVENSMFFC